ncbi:MAG: hypothetical protein K940chlam3_00236 [Chlamydiae bacterium]|nr:hypothetical protein [Chlamydiota bacterium]
MGNINWLEKLGWNEDQIEELRFTGYAYIRQGKYDIALDFFKALTVLNPNDIYDAQTLGAIYVQLDQSEDAIKALENALKLEGDHTPTLINLCKALFVAKKMDEGLKLAEILKKDKNPMISSQAKALLLAFSPPKKKDAD